MFNRYSDLIVNTDVTQVIPAYAVSRGDPTGYKLLLCNKDVQDMKWQYLRSAEGLRSSISDILRLADVLARCWVSAAGSDQLSRSLFCVRLYPLPAGHPF